MTTWDFAGQEVYYPTHQFFLSDHCVYLLVWDLRRKEEDSRIGYWLQSIRTRAESASVILVGTHLDDPKCLKRAPPQFFLS
jgi:leucine-rich repeat kinase 2